MRFEADIEITSAFKGKETLSRQELLEWLRGQFPRVSERTLFWRIFDLQSRRILESPARGIYRLEKKQPFLPAPSSLTKRLANVLRREFPLLETCIWETRWISGWMELQPVHNWTMVETSKEALDAVFSCLAGRFPNVFHDPDPKVVDLYILTLDEVILVKPLISEAPSLRIGPITCCGPEKILVDIVAEPDLFRAQQEEIDRIFENAFREISINQSRMWRYARRRNKLDKIQSLTPPAYRLPPAGKSSDNDT